MPQMSQYHKLNKEIRDLNIHFSKPVVESQNAAIKLVSNKLSFMQRYQRFKSLDFCRTQANGHPTNKVTHVDRTFRNYCNIVDKMDKLIEIYQVNEIQGYGLGFESGFLIESKRKHQDPSDISAYMTEDEVKDLNKIYKQQKDAGLQRNYEKNLATYHRLLKELNQSFVDMPSEEKFQDYFKTEMTENHVESDTDIIGRLFSMLSGNSPENNDNLEDPKTENSENLELEVLPKKLGSKKYADPFRPNITIEERLIQDKNGEKIEIYENGKLIKTIYNQQHKSSQRDSNPKNGPLNQHDIPIDDSIWNDIKRMDQEMSHFFREFFGDEPDRPRQPGNFPGKNRGPPSAYDIQNFNQRHEDFFRNFSALGGLHQNMNHSQNKNSNQNGLFESFSNSYSQMSTSYRDPQRPDVMITKTIVEDGKGVRTTILENGKVVSDEYRKK